MRNPRHKKQEDKEINTSHTLEQLSLQNLEGKKGLSASSLNVPEQISAETGHSMRSLITHLNKLSAVNVSDYSNDEKFLQEMTQKYQLQLQILQQNINGFNQLSKEKNSLFQRLKSASILTPTEVSILSGNFQPVEYRKLVNEIIAKNNKATVPLTPEEIKQLKNPNSAGLQTLLNDLVAQNKLTSDESDQLIDLMPANDAELAARTKQILSKLQQSDLANSSQYSADLAELKAEEKTLEKEFLLILEQYGEIQSILANKIKEFYEQAENQSKKYDLIKQLKRDTGLEIAEGSTFWAEDFSDNTHSLKISIDKVEFGGTSSLLSNQSSAIPNFEPLVTFTTETASGQTNTVSMSAEALNRYFYNFNVQEKIDSVEELSALVGAPITIGQKFTFADGEGENYQEKSFTIAGIENDRIIFDDTITQDRKVPESLLSERQQFDSLTFGEFARWYRQNQTLPEITSLDEVNARLADLNNQFIEDFSLDSEQFPPINLSGTTPLVLVSLASYEKEPETFLINEVTPEGVVYEDGKTVSFGQFLRDVDNNLLVVGTPEIAAKRLEGLALLSEKDQAAAQDEEQKKLESQVKQISSAAEAGKPIPETKKGLLSSFGAHLKGLWANTKVLNIMELIELYWTAPKDEIIASLKSKSEKKVAEVGKGNLYKNLPWPLNMASGLTDTYEDKYNAKNSQEVKDKLEWFEKNKDKDEVKEIMYGTDDKRELKACLKFLSASGALRNDDEKFQETLNNVLGGAVYPSEHLYPKEFWGKPVVIGKDLDKGLFLPDQYKLILEEAYGKGTYDEIFGTNNSKYREKRDRTNSELHDKFEFTREGIGPEIQKRMFAFMKGEKVDAAEFDGMMLGAITKDEISPEQWMMILIFAFGYKNPNGKTLLPYERFNSYVSDLSKIPYFLWFALKHNLVDKEGKPIVDKDGKPVRGHLTSNELNKIFQDVIKKDMDDNIKNGISADSPKVLSAGKNMIKWMHSVPLTHPAITEKAGERAGDAEQSKAIGHYVTPLITNTNAIDSLLIKYQGGRRSEKVIKMAICGYGSQMKARAQLLNTVPVDQRKLAVNNFVNQFTGWIYFDSTIRGMRGTPTRYMRLKDTDLLGTVDADRKREVIEFANENRDFTTRLVHAFARKTGKPEIINLANQVLIGRDQSNDAAEERLRDLLNVEMRAYAETNYEDFARLINQEATSIQGLSGLQLSKEEKDALEEKERNDALKAAA
ncbi:MAG: hypothetical protein ACRCZE_02345 [Candidatus Altimarinota bacterium]